MNKDLKSNRIKNATRNTVYGFINIILSALSSFILRNMLLKYLGADYLGLNSFYQSVVETIGTAELGVGATMVFFLYEPVANDDYKMINAYTLFLKKAYYSIGCIIIIIGLCITPFLHLFISSDIPSNVNTYLLFKIYLLSIALSYFLFPEVVFLSTAYQRDDYNHKIRLTTDSIMIITQIIGLVVYKSYNVFIFAQLVKVIEVGILRFYYEKKKFPLIQPKGKLSEIEKNDIKLKILSMIGHQLDSRLLNGIDNIILSYYLGLTAVGIYGNYFLILSAITWFIVSIFSAVTASIANAIISENIESNYIRYKSLFWLNSIIAGWGTACLLCLYQDFMMVWMGDAFLYKYHVVIAFCIYFYITISRRTTIVFKNAMGMWDSDKAKPYVSLAVDFLLDIILIPRIGAVGAIIASIISEGIIEFPWEQIVLFSEYFEGRAKNTMFDFARYLVNNLIILVLLYILLSNIKVSNYLDVIFKGVICSLIFIVSSCLIYWRTNELKTWRDTIKLLFKG